MKNWEGILAGVAALGGLILVTKTSVVKRRAETVVFNARAPAKKKPLIPNKIIKNPILRGILNDTKSLDFSFGFYDFKYSKDAKGNKEKIIGFWASPITEVRWDTIANKQGYRYYESLQNYGGAAGIKYKKPWYGDVEMDRVYRIAFSPIAKKLYELGIDLEQEIKGYNARGMYNNYEADLNKISIPEIPPMDYQTIESIMTDGGKRNYPADLIDAWVKLLNNDDVSAWNTTLLPRYERTQNNYQDREMANLGLYVWESATEEEQFESELSIRTELNITERDKSFTGIPFGIDNRYRRGKAFGELDSQEKRMICLLWMVVQSMAAHEGRRLWIDNWEKAGYDIEDMRIVTNIQYNTIVYRNKKDVPNKYNTLYKIITKEQSEKIFYSEPFVTKMYLKNKPMIESVKRKLDAKVNAVFEDALKGANQESVDRLKNALIKPYFSNYSSSIARASNLPISRSFDMDRINRAINEDIRLAGNALTENEKKRILSAYEEQLKQEMIDYEVSAVKKRDDKQSELREQIRATEERYKGSISSQKAKNDEYKNALKDKLGL